MTTSTMFRKALVAVSFIVAVATPAVAQLGVTVGTAVDPNLGYYGLFGQTTAGATAVFAQTFQIPAGASNKLQGFTLYLGDFNEGGAGSALLFRAGVYAVTGNQLGAQLFLSGVQNGSGNYTGFDAYSFLTPSLTLTPANGLFALVLQAVGGSNTAQNVIAAGASNYIGGALYAASPTGQLTPQGGMSDAAFSVTFAPAISPVPEPATLALVGTGLIGVAGITRRRRVRR
jgi:hypothetical protein